MQRCFPHIRLRSPQRELDVTNEEFERKGPPLWDCPCFHVIGRPDGFCNAQRFVVQMQVTVNFVPHFTRQAHKSWLWARDSLISPL